MTRSLCNFSLDRPSQGLNTGSNPVETTTLFLHLSGRSHFEVSGRIVGNLRAMIPRSTFFRLKMAAAAEEKSVTDLVLALIEERVQELEKKGLLPKGKGG